MDDSDSYPSRPSIVYDDDTSSAWSWLGWLIWPGALIILIGVIALLVFVSENRHVIAGALPYILILAGIAGAVVGAHYIRKALRRRRRRRRQKGRWHGRRSGRARRHHARRRRRD